MSHMWKLRCDGRRNEQDIKAAPLIHATRVAVTGRTASPGLFEVLVLLGRDRTVARLEQLASFLSSPKLGFFLSENTPVGAIAAAASGRVSRDAHRCPRK